MAIYKYIFSFFIFISTVSLSFAQDDEIYAPVKEKEPLQFKGIKLGVNVGRYSDFLFKPERKSSEYSLDVNFGHTYYGAVEVGFSEINMEKENYSYFSDGRFYKIGFDYNMLKKQPTDYLGIGVRIGRADYEHYASNVTFEDIHWSVQNLDIDKKSYQTYWLEVSFGLKGELLKNVYFGWAALARVAISGRKDNEFQPYDIPGFGKGSNTVNLGANYYIYYQIPFNRKK